MKKQITRFVVGAVAGSAAFTTSVAFARPLGTPRVNDVEVAQFVMNQTPANNSVPTQTVCTGTDGGHYVSLGGPGFAWSTAYPGNAGVGVPLSDQSPSGLPVSLDGDDLAVGGTLVATLSDLANPGPSVGLFQGTMTITNSTGKVVAQGPITLPAVVSGWAPGALPTHYVPDNAYFRGTVNLPMKSSSGVSLIANVELDLNGPGGDMSGSFGQSESPSFPSVPDISVEWNGQTC